MELFKNISADLEEIILFAIDGIKMYAGFNMTRDEIREKVQSTVMAKREIKAKKDYALFIPAENFNILITKPNVSLKSETKDLFFSVPFENSILMYVYDINPKSSVKGKILFSSRVNDYIRFSNIAFSIIPSDGELEWINLVAMESGYKPISGETVVLLFENPEILYPLSGFYLGAPASIITGKKEIEIYNFPGKPETVFNLFATKEFVNYMHGKESIFDDIMMYHMFMPIDEASELVEEENIQDEKSFVEFVLSAISDNFQVRPFYIFKIELQENKIKAFMFPNLSSIYISPDAIFEIIDYFYYATVNKDVELFAIPSRSYRKADAFSIVFISPFSDSAFIALFA